MRSLVCVLLLAALAGAVEVPFTRERIIDGLLFWLDGDRNGAISIQELNSYVVYRPCGPDPLHFIGEYIISNTTQGGCDCDNSGDLTAADFDCPDSCMRSEALWLFITNKIIQCETYNAV